MKFFTKIKNTDEKFYKTKKFTTKVWSYLKNVYYDIMSDLLTLYST